MAVLTICSSELEGYLDVPSSKSLAHRAIIAASLCDGISFLKNVNFSNDVLETLNAIKSLGVKFEFFSNNGLKIFGGLRQLALKQNVEEIKINCLECASTIRFLMPVLTLLGFKVKFIVGARLFERLCLCDDFFYCEVGKYYFKTNKKIKYEYFFKKKCYTSQFITGLLLILPTLEKSSLIIFKNMPESNGFIELTISFLNRVGIKIKKLQNGFQIFGNQIYRPFVYEIEGDFSLASFFAVAGCFNKISLGGLNSNSVQSEAIIINILKHCGAKVSFKKKKLTVCPGSDELKCFEVDLKNNIDLAPILAVLASFCSGVSKLFGVHRLKFKESNRILSILNLINGLGGKAGFFGYYLKIKGVNQFSGGIVDCNNDHRIAMAAAVASCSSKNKIVLLNANCVLKSWPGFFDSFKKLGGLFYGFGLE